MSSPSDPRARPAWILGSGMVLVGLGLVAQSQSTNPPPPAPSPSFMTQGFGTSDSNGGMIAVTGVDVTGGTLLFLVDTVGRHLAVYQAQGGTSSTANLKWIGGRNIDLDLQVDGFNDKSEMKYKELKAKFDEQ